MLKSVVCVSVCLITLGSMTVASAAGEPVKLEQIISREHPQFNTAQASLSVGQDGLVYLGSIGPDNTAYVIRITHDGQQKYGGSITYALASAAANKEGVLASANGHFAHKVALYDQRFKQYAEVSDFLVGDSVGWDAPSHVEAGASGDFYGMDKHRNRILRVTPQGKVLKAYAIPRLPEGNDGMVENFRVSEKLSAFFLITRGGPLRVIGFDGQPRWTTPHRVGLSHPGTQGGYDIDAEGNLYVVEARANKVIKLNPNGEQVGEIALKISNFPPPHGTHEGIITGLQIRGDEILLKRWDPTVLFERYDSASGEFKGAVASDYERLTVTYPSDLWRAGETIDFGIDFHSGKRTVKPQWRVWIRPLNTLAYREIAVRNGKITIPEDLGGIYQIKVSPEVQPWERGKRSEYLVRGWVEVRSPNARGSLSVTTPNCRVDYGRGEVISLSVIARAADTAPAQMTLKLRQGNRDLASSQTDVAPGKVLQTSLPAEFTRALSPGEYQIVAAAPNMTSISQTIRIGRGERASSFLRMRHGDYGPTYPSADVSTAPDVVAAHVVRERMLGFNTFVDRLGTHLQIGGLAWDGNNQAKLNELAKRLQDDPTAAAPETVQMASPLLQVMAAYSAHSMRQMAILLYMDAGLPLGGPGFDSRKPEKMVEDLQTVTKGLLAYPAFRGWSWHGNWWIYNERGSAAATSPEQKAAYEAALKKARETGEWSAVLDQVSERRLGFAVEAQELFKTAMRKVSPDGRLKTATAGTYRNVESYPPISFQNVDEVDLQGQFEQIFLPYFPTHAVDFCRRPGKPVWGHPEIWNDDGTGGQILPELFSMLMRSPHGLGLSGPVPPWSGTAGIPEDSRSAHFGMASVFRAMNRVLERYGAWISTLETDDRVAIIGSPRQFKVDEWGHVMGKHFARVMEAYVACLHAHHPARIVFVDDLKPETLAQYKAVLLVDQWIELEPQLAVALQKAKAAGTRIYYDGACRASLMQDFTPLGIAFDKFEQDRHPASDDAAYYRFPRYVKDHLPALRKALDAATAPAARIENPEVWASQLKSSDARYLFVVNNTSVPLEPSQMWRTTLHVASLLPVVARIEFTTAAPAVYDVFAMRQVKPEQNSIIADLRDLPARLYAILPAAIDKVALRGPAKAVAGQTLPWQAEVLDAGGKPIAASVPLVARLLDVKGRVLDEAYITASAAAQGEFVAPLDAAAGELRLEVTELLSGKTTRLSIAVTHAPLPVPLLPLKFDASAAKVETAGKPAVGTVEANEQDFGPHLRDLVIAADGKSAVASAMNWGDNLYGIDLNDGNVKWRGKVGHHFAFAPQSLSNRVVVQGFDYQTAAGYHLYRIDDQGGAVRRFALYGLPRRLPHRFVPALFNDRDAPANNFAASPDGSWFAAAGDLGLAVWSDSGKLLWKQDWTEDRRPARLAALGASALLVAREMSVSAHDVQSGKPLWREEVAATGTVRKMAVSGDGRTAAVLATTDGGRIFVLRGGKLINTLSAAGDDIDTSADGSRLVAVDANQLSYFTLDGGLQWSFAGDDRLRNPRLTTDGKRVAVASELGSVYVLDERGKLLHEEDNVALSVPAWLPGGDLVLANWMGKVSRLGSDFQPKWNVRLKSARTDVATLLTARADIPTARVDGWGNAAAEPLPLTSNLLRETKALIRFVADGANHIGLARPADALVDGDTKPPAEPWLEWGDVNWFAESNPNTYLTLDTFRTQLRVDAITFVEDPDRPDSWLRDAALEYWDTEREQWIPAMSLLSDIAVHTHKLPKPIEAARFRVLIPRGFYGNLRLAEIALHGTILGPSHPDVIAKRPIAVLFDESEEFKNIYPYADRWSFQLEGAYAGGRFLQVNANQTIAPAFIPPFGHAVPNWNFEIAEVPQPGQYRYLQWAWKALSPEVKGATLQVGGMRLHAGQAAGEAHIPAYKVGESVPGEWQVMRVDLWKLAKKSLNIESLYLSATGGPVGFDQIVLSETEEVLDKLAQPSGSAAK